jgi:ATP-binding cassette subfamily F protein 3
MQISLSKEVKSCLCWKNGEGKSTMIKAIMKELQIDSGVLEIGHNAQIGYFALKPSFVIRRKCNNLKPLTT